MGNEDLFVQNQNHSAPNKSTEPNKITSMTHVNDQKGMRMMYFIYRWSLALRYPSQVAQKPPVQVSLWSRNYYLHHSHNVCIAMLICFAGTQQ